ncbi:hypothetical protein HY408_01220 [Candidatus Gottesmanbacteria bacterium]|nr:hypothetical protein [Candidatus Gottesmanbacteria bacterium]
MRKHSAPFLKTLQNRFNISKRQEVVIVITFLALELLSTQLFLGSLRLDLLLALSVSAYILSAIVLRQGLTGWDFLTLLILPTYFTAAVYVFYFLLPVRWLTRLPTLAVYAVGMYIILLSENIYNVASERNIQLFRVAHVGGFVLSLLSMLLLLNTVLSMHLPFYFNVLSTLLIVFPLVLQALWSMELTQTISKKVWIGSGVITLIITEFAFAFSFWPIKTELEAIFLTTAFYSLVGMTQQYLIERLFATTAREYMMWFTIILILILGITLGYYGWGSSTL